jgi:dihydropteroate synthase
MSAVWRCGEFAFELARPLVMGIVNVTPDSFSDGGDTSDTASAVAAGRAHLAAGADLLDVGGESTRPGAEPVDAEAEAARVLPVVAELASSGVCVSVDTRRASVAQACVEAGACVVNDVDGFRDEAMVRVAAGSGAGVVVMHMRGEPRTMQAAPEYDDVVAEVRAFLEAQARVLRDAGVSAERIALDPGIGFGKSTAHNLELLARLGEIASLGYPVLVGVSRKRFIGEITGEPEPKRRVAGSVAGALAAVERRAAIVRVHDVAETVAALKVARAIETGRTTW